MIITKQTLYILEAESIEITYDIKTRTVACLVNKISFSSDTITNNVDIYTENISNQNGLYNLLKATFYVGPDKKIISFFGAFPIKIEILNIVLKAPLFRTYEFLDSIVVENYEGMRDVILHVCISFRQVFVDYEYCREYVLPISIIPYLRNTNEESKFNIFKS